MVTKVRTDHLRHLSELLLEARIMGELLLLESGGGVVLLEDSDLAFL